MSPEEVQKALCHRVIAVRGEVMEKRHTDSEASFGRDAFAKVILSSLDSHLGKVRLIPMNCVVMANLYDIQI